MLRIRLTLAPGANGTKKLLVRYGDRLVCVRYRYARERARRVKTVELIEEESPWMPSAALYLVKIDFEETALRQRLKEEGGRWDAQRRLWVVRGDVVRRLGMEDRIAGWVEVE